MTRKEIAMPLAATKMVWFALLALGWTATTLQAQTTLRYQFKEGEKIRYIFENKAETSMAPMEKEIASKTAQVLEMTWHVAAVGPDGKAKIKMKIDRWKMTSEGLGGNLNIDSANLKNADDQTQKTLVPLIKSIKAMIEADFTMTRSVTGEITDLVAPESFKEAPGSEQLRDRFSRESFSLLVVPREAVVRGKTWEQKTEVKLWFGQLKTRLVYTYEGPVVRRDRKLEQISLATQITLESDPDAPFQVELKRQDGQGTAYFDNAAGRLVELTLNQTMQMEISAMGQTAQQSLKQTTALKLQDR